MEDNIFIHIKECLKFHASKSNKFPTITPLHPMPQYSEPNQPIHMDLIGHCKSSDMGNKYVVTITDAFTKYTEICAIPNKEAVTVAGLILSKWIYMYGSPAIIQMDRSKEFIIKMSNELYNKINIKRTHTAPAHPQCNSQVKVLNQK
jgi:hypothetical protein